jgi:hypothetical protein
MLPDFQDRHLPDVILPRVASERPQALLLPNRSILADANFITLRGSDQLPAAALVALLNTCWIWDELERLGSVLGGGALKLESATIRRLPIPELSHSQLDSLAYLGRKRGADRTPMPWLDADEIIGGSAKVERSLRSALTRLSARNPTNKLQQMNLSEVLNSCGPGPMHTTKVS